MNDMDKKDLCAVCGIAAMPMNILNEKWLCDKCFAAFGFLANKKEKDPNGIDQHSPGAKLDSGKPLAGLLGDFSRALGAVVDVGTYGAKKYSRGGWQSVPDGQQRYTDAMWRHMLAENREALDESGLLHMAHTAWNALARLELELRRRSIL